MSKHAMPNEELDRLIEKETRHIESLILLWEKLTTGKRPSTFIEGHRARLKDLQLVRLYR